MVQEFNVVCCYSCSTYQTEQVKKSTNKWTCKICHEKQSLKLVFFTGSARECRSVVQQQNMKRCTRQNQTESLRHVTSVPDNDSSASENEGNVNPPVEGASKWLAFVDEPYSTESESDSEQTLFRDSGRSSSRKRMNHGRTGNINRGHTVNLKKQKFRQDQYNTSEKNNNFYESIQCDVRDPPILSEHLELQKQVHTFEETNCKTIGTNNKSSEATKIRTRPVPQHGNSEHCDLQKADMCPVPNKFSKWSKYLEIEGEVDLD